MRMRPTQRMLVQLARDIRDEELQLLMELTGAQARVKEKFKSNAIGYFMYLKGKHRSLLGFLDSLKNAFRTSELESLCRIVDQHEGDCREDDLTKNPCERLRRCTNHQQLREFKEITLKMDGYVVKKDVDIMTAVSPINEGMKSGIMSFIDLCSKMKDCGCISENSVEFLRELLIELRLAEPLSMLDEYENNIPTPSENPDILHRQQHTLHRQDHIRERPGPSPNSDRNSRSQSAPEDSLSNNTYNTSSSTASGYFTPQGDLQSLSRLSRLRKAVSVPYPTRISRLREELGIPHDSTYPGGMSVSPSPAATSTFETAPRQVPPVSSAWSMDSEPSAPPRDEEAVGQANPPVSDAQVIPSSHLAGIHNPASPSALRGPLDSRTGLSNSCNPDRFNIEEQSSQSTYDSNANFPAPKSRENTGQLNLLVPNHTNPLERQPQEQCHHNEDLSSSSTYHCGGDQMFANPRTREHSGPSGVAYPSLHRFPAPQAPQPPVIRANIRVGVGSNPGQHSNPSIGGTHGDRFNSLLNSSLHSSAVAGLPSGSLGGSTLSESGNFVGHPSSYETHSGILPSGGGSIYPVLPSLNAEEGHNRMSRKRSPLDFQRVEKRIKTEDESEEEEFGTPPESPVKKPKR